MFCLSTVSRRSALAVVFGAALLTTPIPARAQQAPAPEPLNIETVDGVKLKAIFYPSSMQGAPTVIMLHPIGEGKHMKNAEWKSLAEYLQSKNFSVMTFDFRGHGDSTTIADPKAFWGLLANKAVKTKDLQAIEVKDYMANGKAYLPVLINDIAAVRAYLDRRNDDRKDCNTSNLIVIGADQGATLGAIWINSEWYRYKFTPNPMFPQRLDLGQFATKSEGPDIVAAVFLTIEKDLKGRPVKIDAQLRNACKENGMACLFMSGTKGADWNKGIADKLKPKKESEKHKFIGDYALKTDLTGVKLLQKGLETDAAIAKYLDGVMDGRKCERMDRSFKDSYYLWKMGPNPNAWLKARNDKSKMTLNFDDYGKFIAP
jgi:hypothetical protein